MIRAALGWCSRKLQAAERAAARSRWDVWGRRQARAWEEGSRMARAWAEAPEAERRDLLKSWARRSLALEALALPGRAAHGSAVALAFLATVSLLLPPLLILAAVERRNRWSDSRACLDAISTLAGEAVLALLGSIPQALLWERAERPLRTLDVALGRVALDHPGAFDEIERRAWAGASAHCHASWACEFDHDFARALWGAERACGVGSGGSWTGWRGMTAWSDARLMASSRRPHGIKWMLKWGRAPWSAPASAIGREARRQASEGSPRGWAAWALASLEAAEISASQPEPKSGPSRAPRL